MLPDARYVLEQFEDARGFERFCRNVLMLDEYQGVEPQAPGGGSDGGKDIEFRIPADQGGGDGLALVTLRDDIGTKFNKDISKRTPGEYDLYILFTIQTVTPTVRKRIKKYCQDNLGVPLHIQDINVLEGKLEIPKYASLRRRLGLSRMLLSGEQLAPLPPVQKSITLEPRPDRTSMKITSVPGLDGNFLFKFELYLNLYLTPRFPPNTTRLFIPNHTLKVGFDFAPWMEKPPVDFGEVKFVATSDPNAPIYTDGDQLIVTGPGMVMVNSTTAVPGYPPEALQRVDFNPEIKLQCKPADAQKPFVYSILLNLIQVDPSRFNLWTLAKEQTT